MKEATAARRRRFRRRARRAVADLLELVHRRHAEVRRPDPAGRQRRRRRNLSLLALRPAEARHGQPVGATRRSRWRHSARRCSLRCHDHAGDLRASSARRPRAAGPRLRAPCSRSRSASSSRSFAIQRRGTARVGGLFGPIMVLWFDVRGARCSWIVDAPEVLVRRVAAPRGGAARHSSGRRADDPRCRVPRAYRRRSALRGHGPFGKRPAIAWLGLVWPALLLNRSGRAADHRRRPRRNPLFALVRRARCCPRCVCSPRCRVIASQATISGAFSVTRQAVQLDLLPRLELPNLGRRRGQITYPRRTRSCSSPVVGFVLRSARRARSRPRTARQ